MNHRLALFTVTPRGCAALCWVVSMVATSPASPQTAVVSPAAIPTSAPSPAVDPHKALLELDQLELLPAAPQTPEPGGARPASALSERGAQYVRRGEELIAEERFTEAGRELEKALRSDPTRFEIHRALALAMFRAGNKERAVAHAKQAIQYQPDDVLPHYILGRIAFDEANLVEAIASLRRAVACSNLDTAPDFAALTYAYLARSLEAEGYLTAALRAYGEYERRAGVLAPALSASNQELGSLLRVDRGSAQEPVSRILDSLGRPAEAADALGRWLAGREADAATRVRYARLLAGAQRFDEALAQCRLVGASAEDPAPYIQLLSDIRGMMGQPQLALDDVRSLLKDRPGDPKVMRAYVDLLRRFGEVQEAERIITEFLAAHPEASDLGWELCDEYIRAGRKGDAFALACRMAAADPQAHPHALIRLETLAQDAKAVEEILGREWGAEPINNCLLGILALRAGRVERGVALLRAALESAPTLTPARFALGEHLVKEYRWQEAIDVVGADGEKDNNLEWVLGEAYAGLDEDEKAADHYSAAIRLNRVDTRAMFALAQLYERTDRPLRAQRQLEAILQTDPLHERSREALVELLAAGRQLQEAQAQLAELRKLAASPNRVARCTARLELAGGSGSLERYRQLLEEAMTQAGPDADSLALVAVSFLGENDAPAAEAALRKALEIDPANPQVRELLVPVYARELRFPEAAAEMRELLRRHPHRAAWIKSLAEILRVEQDYDGAAAVLTTFLERGKLGGKLLAEMRQALLQVLQSARRHSERIAVIQKWMRQDESDRSLRVPLIESYLDDKDFDAALERTRKWLEEAPGEAGTLALHREVLRRAGRLVTVEQMLLDALEQDPGNEELQVALIGVLKEAKRFDDALELVDSRVNEPPGGTRDVRFMLVKWDLLDEARRYDDAVLLLTRMIQDESVVGEGGPLEIDLLQLQLARMLVEAERYQDAQARLTRWIEQAQSEEARFNYLRLLSVIHQQRNLPERALESLEMAYAIRPDSAAINNDLGYTLADVGRRLTEAERMVRLAVGGEPENSAYLDSFGWVLYRQGRFQDARHWLVKASRAPDDRGEDPVIFDHLGDACWQVLAHDDAVQHWKKSVVLAEERLKEREEPTYRRVFESAQKKLEAVEAAQVPEVATVVREADEPRHE